MFLAALVFFALPMVAIIAIDVLTHYTVTLLIRQKDSGALADD